MRRHSRRRSGGFSLTELVLCSAIFSLLTALCLLLAVRGFAMFEQSNARQSLQKDARAIFSWLQRDVGLSNLVRCVVSAQTVEGAAHDTLAVVGMASWQQPVTSDALGLPAWNSVVVYQSTPDGLLFRSYCEASAAGLSVPLVRSEVATALQQAVHGSLPYRDRRQLSSSIAHFAVVLDEGRNSAHVDLMLRTTTRGVGADTQRGEVLQLNSMITPRNTWPRL